MNRRSNITTDVYNLRTQGTIKDLPWYHGSIRKVNPTPTFDDNQYPFVEFDVKILQDDYRRDDTKDMYGEFTWDWTPFKLEDNTGWNRSIHERGPYYAPEDSYEDRFGYYQSQGMSKGLADYNARKEIYNDADTLRKFEEGHRSYVFVSVTASIDGIEITDESLGGIDCEYESDPYVQETIDEMKLNIVDRLLECVEDRFNQFSEVYNTVKLALATS